MLDEAPAVGGSEGGLDPEMAAALQRMAAIVAGLPDRRGLPLDEARRVFALERAPWNADRPVLPEVRDLVVPGPQGGSVGVRLYRPALQGPLPVVLYAHGGGWVFGNNDTHDRIMRALSLESGAAVIGVEYGLSPETPWPGARDEVLCVWQWLTREAAALGLDDGRLALAGDSAGAHIALSAALARRDTGRAPPRGLALFYGVFGPACETPSYRAFADGRFGLSREQMQGYWAAYLGRGESHEADLTNASLVGLPPVHLAAAELDVLRDDTVILAQALKRAGIAHEMRIYPGVCHSFLLYAPVLATARRAIARAAAFLAACLSVAQVPRTDQRARTELGTGPSKGG